MSYGDFGHPVETQPPWLTSESRASVHRPLAWRGNGTGVPGEPVQDCRLPFRPVCPWKHTAYQAIPEAVTKDILIECWCKAIDEQIIAYNDSLL